MLYWNLKRILGLAALLPAWSSALAQQPPAVVSLSPADGSKNVDPNTPELIVKFDRDMKKGSHSLCGGGSTFPKLRGQPVWKDPQTLVIRVKLEPEHSYEFSLNCQSFRNFVSADGVPLEPTPWRFTTGSRRGKAEQKALNERALDELMGALQESYSYFDRKKLKWDKLVEKHRKKIVAAKNTNAWVERIAKMLAAAEDPHLWINFGGKTTGTHQRKYQPNFNLKGVEAVLGALNKRSEHAYTAKTDDDIAYLLIPSWSGDRDARVSELEVILTEFKDAKGMILDVRPNGGGDELMAQAVAAWFVKGEKVYSKNAYRDASAEGGFGQVFDRVIKGNAAPKRFDRPVMVLMGPANLSSCESFLLMMKEAKKAKLIGGKSGGSSGNPKPRLLENGVEVFIPSWKDFFPDGMLFEGVGVTPDIKVKSKPADFEKGDPVLERALKELRKEKKKK